MTISSIPGSNNLFAQLNLRNTTASNTNQTPAGLTIGGQNQSSQGGGLVNSVLQALSQIGVGQTSGSTNTAVSSTLTTNNSASTSGATSQSATQMALASFIQSLMAALQGQSGTNGTTDPNAQTTGNPGMQGMHHHGGHHLQAALQNLIQQLSGTSSSSATSGTTSSQSTSSLANLQQSFQSLVTAMGSNSSSTSLTGFLQAFSNGLPGSNTSAVGNLLQTSI
ncbi:hypothetical protein BI364_02770 [Acidihalobacter yilgarnensis]|uniref:Uncharacterized protein n=1 Tax=Acidihalobacter yilgarnensis TaxID=2819280 RepID=A0A1D8IKR8_9GAMM|nr:hypothetical protein [Acidihalobacter yilgarnensis]AOU97069.1 hypothetical protein BI364_02770 [Acidihalobacter yilgarnensis]